MPRRLLTLLALGALLTARTAHAQASDEEVLVQLQLGRLAARTVVAYRAGEEVLLPLTDFLDLAEVGYTLPGPGVVDIRFQPGDVHLLIDGQRDTLMLDKRLVPIPPGALAEHDGQVYLASSQLASMLGVRFAIDWSELSVTVANPERLPLGRRIQREAARSSLAALHGTVVPELALPLERRRWNGMVLDYTLLSPASDFLGGGSYATALGMDVLGGSFEVGVASEGRIDEGDTRTDISWSGVWRERRWLKQLRLGDGLATGPRPRTVRGFSISNAPFQRPALLGEIPFAGRLGPGWQVEAYRGGRLVAFDSADALGQFSIDMPVQYGENPVDFVAYGPFGEIREFSQTYRVAGNVLPDHQFEYGVSAGQCRSDGCQASANLDLRYGLNPRWTVQAGVDQFWRRRSADLSHPYASLAGAIGNAWLVQVDAVLNAVWRSALAFEPSTDLRLSTEINLFDRDVAAPILTPAGRRSQWTTEAFIRPVPRLGSFYLDGSLDLIRQEAGRNTSARLGASFQAAEIRMLPSIRVQHDSPDQGPSATHTYFGLSTFILPRASWGSLLGQVSARTSLDTDGGLRPIAWSAYLARPLSSGLRVETGMSWHRDLGSMFTLVFSTTLHSVRAYSTVQSGPVGTDAVNYVQGAVLYDPERRQVALNAGPAVERAGVAGQVFLDSNGNGRRDIGEELLPDVRVRVGNFTAVTDSQGRYQVWDLLPYEPTLVVVDSLTLASPLWIPSYSAISVEPGPNQFRSLDLPVVPAGVIEGRVLRSTPTGPAGVPGATLLVTNRRTGARTTVVTFRDGGYYLMGVKPGEYEITMADATARRLGQSADPVRFTLHPSRDGESLAGLDLTLHP